MKIKVHELRKLIAQTVKKQLVKEEMEEMGLYRGKGRHDAEHTQNTQWISSSEWHTGPLEVTAEVDGNEARVTTIRKNGQPINFDQWLQAENKQRFSDGDDPLTDEEVHMTLQQEALQAAESDTADMGGHADDENFEETRDPEGDNDDDTFEDRLAQAAMPQPGDEEEHPVRLSNVLDIGPRSDYNDNDDEDDILRGLGMEPAYNDRDEKIEKLRRSDTGSRFNSYGYRDR